MRRGGHRREGVDTGQRHTLGLVPGGPLSVWQRGLGLAELVVVLVGAQSDVLILNPCVESL